MATNVEQFLDLYRTYEQLLRADGHDPKEMEDLMAGQDGERLRMCRQFRNFLSHVSDPGFIDPSEKMLRFMTDQVNTMKTAGDIVKKHIKRPDACIIREDQKVQDAIMLASKLKFTDMVLLHKDGTYGTINLFSLIQIKPSAKLSTVKAKKLSPRFCAPLDNFAALDPTKIYLCTNTGTPDGKLLGQVWFN